MSLTGLLRTTLDIESLNLKQICLRNLKNDKIMYFQFNGEFRRDIEVASRTLRDEAKEATISRRMKDLTVIDSINSIFVLIR